MIAQFFKSFIINRIIGHIFNKFVIKFSSKRNQTILVMIMIYAYFGIYVKLFMQKSFYQELGLQLDADTNRIKKSFREYSLKNHPDKMKDNVSEYVDWQEMYQILTNSDDRWLYDRFHITIKDSQQNSKENLIIRNLFNFLMQTIIEILFTIMFNFKTQRYFKEMILFSLGLVSFSFYLFFLKEGSNIVDFIFPGLTIHQINKLITSNYNQIQTIFQLSLYYIYFKETNIKIVMLSKIKSEIEDKLKGYQDN